MRSVAFDRRPAAAAPILAVALIAVTLSACGSAGGGTRATGASPQAATTSAPYDPVAACARKLDYWITTDFLQGQPDRGDYQEMGLSGAEGLALRNLEGELAATIKAFPARPPADLAAHELRDCTAAGAATSNTANWP